MFDTELLVAVAQWRDDGIKLAEAFREQRSGAVAGEVLTEVLAAVQQGELVTCLATERTDRTGEFAADGSASTAAYVRGLSNETGQWASLRVRLGRALVDRLPATRAAWERGDLGLAHAAEIMRATNAIDDLDQLAVLDQIFADATPGCSPTELKTLADRILAQEAPEQTAKKDADQRAAQKLNMVQTMNGMWDLSGRFTPEDGARINATLDFFTPKPPSAEQILADPAASTTPGQRRAQALVDICRQAQQHAEGCRSQGAGRGTLIVALPLQDLQSARGVGDVAGDGTIPAAALRRWACDTGIIPMVLGGDSQILDFGRTTRVIPFGVRNRLVARDGGCIGPKCDRPPAFTEAHHRIHWLFGGETELFNLDLLCLAHHHLVHEGGWTLTVDDDIDRTPWFHPPNGKPPIKGQRRPLIPVPRQQRSTRQRGNAPSTTRRAA